MGNWKTFFKQLAHKQLDMGETDHVCTVLLPLNKKAWRWFAEMQAVPRDDGLWDVIYYNQILMDHIGHNYKRSEKQYRHKGVSLESAMEILEKFENAWPHKNWHFRLSKSSPPSNHYSKVRKSLRAFKEKSAMKLTAGKMAKKRRRTKQPSP